MLGCATNGGTNLISHQPFTIDMVAVPKIPPWQGVVMESYTWCKKGAARKPPCTYLGELFNRSCYYQTLLEKPEDTHRQQGKRAEKVSQVIPYLNQTKEACSTHQTQRRYPQITRESSQWLGLLKSLTNIYSTNVGTSSQPVRPPWDSSAPSRFPSRSPLRLVSFS